MVESIVKQSILNQASEKPWNIIFMLNVIDNKCYANCGQAVGFNQSILDVVFIHNIRTAVWVQSDF